MSGVQPITPNEPTTAVVLANLAAAAAPLTPTNPAYSATAPSQTLSGFGAYKQLPDNILTAMASQQAVTTANLSLSQKNELGIIDGSVGATLYQLSLPGQPIKPGAGDFIKDLMNTAPGYPFTKTATGVLMTGASGVTGPEALLENNTAQLGAITNSIQNATVGLTNSGVLTGLEDPTQVSGVIMAASTSGVETVTNLLKNPSSVLANINSAPGIAGQIAAGNFAAGLADKFSNGVSGVASSIGSFASNLGGSISSGFSAISGGLQSTMQSAFSIAEESFGKLKAGVVNTLGGLPAIKEVAVSGTAEALRNYEIAAEEVIEAEQQLGQAKKAYSVEESQETYEALRLAEGKLAAAQQKLAQADNKISSGAAEQANTGLFGGVGAQTVAALGAAAASGTLETPTSENTGVNALPGGLGAFANTLGAAAGNLLSTAKTTIGTLGTNLSGAIGALSDPSGLVGNLVSNVQDKLGGIAEGLKQGLSNLSSVASTTVDNAKAAYSAITGASGANLGGVGSNLSSALGSIGNMPGQIKAAILASDTFANTKAVVEAVTNKTLDPKVPPPVFDAIVVKIKSDKNQAAQLATQIKLQNLEDDRSNLSYKLDTLIEQYEATQQADLITKLDDLRKELAAVNVEIDAAQKAYDRTLRG